MKCKHFREAHDLCVEPQGGFDIIDGKRHQAATSIGVRPTFGLSQRLVEVFVMDFSEDLYGKIVGVEFIKKVRDQEKFDGLDALIKQINQDVDDCRQALDRSA